MIIANSPSIFKRMVYRLFSCCTIVFLVLNPLLSLAQSNISTLPWHWINETVAESPYKYAGQNILYLGDMELSVRGFIKSKYGQFQDKRSDLKLTSIRKSDLGNHLTFSQTFLGKRIYGTEVKVNIRERLVISSCFVTVLKTSHWSNSLAETSMKPTNEAENIIFYYNETPHPAWLYDVHDEQENVHLKIIQAENGLSFMRSLERNLYGQPKDTTIWVYVFNPDPLTTAGVVYGGAFINNNDKDTAVLTAERQLLPVAAYYSPDSFWAGNKYVNLISDDVNFQIPWSPNDTFDYTRSQPEFEFMMALYHITKYKEYINSLGFDSLMNYRINVRPRAFTDDNSNFQRTSNSNGKGLLRFGNSSKSIVHIDDAEDADVIVHEYGHAISYNANLNELDGAGRKALDEGLCDYLAASYSKQLNPFRASYVYSWDGHNPYWEGRVCFTNKTCKDFNSNKTIYENGEIFASALYDINEVLGSEITDRILINSMYEYADRMEFKHGAELYINAELELYKGIYHDAICTIFKKYAFVNDEYCQLSIGAINRNGTKIFVDKLAFAHNGYVQIQFPNEYSGSIRVYNTEGKLVFEQDVSGLRYFDTQVTCPPGLYFITFNDGWNVQSEKLIK